MRFEFLTPRLLIRMPDISDAQMVLNFYNNNITHFGQYETDKPADFYTIEFQKKILQYEEKEAALGRGIRLYIFEKDVPDRIVGSVSFSHILRGSFNNASLGYKIDKDFLRRGYAFEAVHAALNKICPLCRLHRIEAYIKEDNAASIHLIEKLGFMYEGVAHDYVKIQGKYCDLLRYAYISDAK